MSVRSGNVVVTACGTSTHANRDGPRTGHRATADVGGSLLARLAGDGEATGEVARDLDGACVERGSDEEISRRLSWCDVCTTVLTRGKAIDFLLARLAAVVVLAGRRVELPLLDVARDANGVGGAACMVGSVLSCQL